MQIVYESDEEFGTLPVINSDQTDVDLPSNKMDAAKLEHLIADKTCILEIIG